MRFFLNLVLGQWVVSIVSVYKRILVFSPNNFSKLAFSARKGILYIYLITIKAGKGVLHINTSFFSECYITQVVKSRSNKRLHYKLDDLILRLSTLHLTVRIEWKTPAPKVAYSIPVQGEARFFCDHQLPGIWWIRIYIAINDLKVCHSFDWLRR